MNVLPTTAISLPYTHSRHRLGLVQDLLLGPSINYCFLMSCGRLGLTVLNSMSILTEILPE